MNECISVAAKETKAPARKEEAAEKAQVVGLTARFLHEALLPDEVPCSTDKEWWMRTGLCQGTVSAVAPKQAAFTHPASSLTEHFNQLLFHHTMQHIVAVSLEPLLHAQLSPTRLV